MKFVLALLVSIMGILLAVQTKTWFAAGIVAMAAFAGYQVGFCKGLMERSDKK